MMISIIAALGRNRVIGSENSIPWKLPADMKRFRELTTGKPVIMGRKTFESIGRPLPNRANIIITTDKNYRADSCIVVHSVDEALKAAKGSEIMVIGGSQIYKQFLPTANRMYLTFIDKEFEGDAYFPEYSEHEWKETSREEHVDENGLKYSFVNFERVKS